MLRWSHQLCCLLLWTHVQLSNRELPSTQRWRCQPMYHLQHHQLLGRMRSQLSSQLNPQSCLRILHQPHPHHRWQRTKPCKVHLDRSSVVEPSHRLNASPQQSRLGDAGELLRHQARRQKTQQHRQLPQRISGLLALRRALSRDVVPLLAGPVLLSASRLTSSKRERSLCRPRQHTQEIRQRIKTRTSHQLQRLRSMMKSCTHGSRSLPQ
mmetsp:Transcript_44194/g.79520  ORF Transcript_44194/g.79520 Transcript_44194/m.79520 type:complete len:210 (+) Transcript_44194:1785-2414(+)